MAWRRFHGWCVLRTHSGRLAAQAARGARRHRAVKQGWPRTMSGGNETAIHLVASDDSAPSGNESLTPSCHPWSGADAVRTSAALCPSRRAAARVRVGAAACTDTPSHRKRLDAPDVAVIALASLVVNSDHPHAAQCINRPGLESMLARRHRFGNSSDNQFDCRPSVVKLLKCVINLAFSVGTNANTESCCLSSQHKPPQSMFGTSERKEPTFLNQNRQ